MPAKTAYMTKNRIQTLFFGKSDVIKLITLSVKISSVINFVGQKISLVKSEENFFTFHRRNFLTAFSDREENKFFFDFLFVFDFKIKLI